MRRTALGIFMAVALCAGLYSATWRALPAYAAAPLAGTISTYAGGGSGSGLGTAIPQHPGGLAINGSTLYISDSDGNVVRALNTGTGVETLVAGTGAAGTTGDGGQATAAQVAYPTGLAVDSGGNLYIAASGRIRKVTPAGVITTLAGGGSGPLGDGGLATSATLSNAWGVAVDSSGNVFIADTFNNRIRTVDHTTGIITTVAGNGIQGYAGDGGPATSAEFTYPEDVWVDGSGNLWIADSQNNSIRKVVGGTINTVAGTGMAGTGGDGGLATLAQLWEPRGVWVDGSGNLFIADQFNHRVREVIGGNISTVAGSGTAGYNGDGISPTAAQLNRPVRAIKDGSGSLFIADNGNARVRKVAAGTIATVAGTGSACGLNGDGGQATAAKLCTPSGLAVDGSGDLFIADTSGQAVREVSSLGVLSTVAGDGKAGSIGDGGSATLAELNNPTGVAVDGSGNVYIADTGNHVVRKISGGVITRYAGTTGSPGLSGDSGPATAAQLNGPSAVAVDAGGNVFIADTSNHRIRKVTPGGTITTVAGTTYGSGGDNGPAISAQLAWPQGVAVDGSGNIYVGDTGNTRIRKVDAGGTITTVANAFVRQVAVGPQGQVLGASDASHQVFLLSTIGLIPIAGTGAFGFSGDGGPATAAQLYAPVGVTVDASGDIFIADQFAFGADVNGRVRRVQAYTAPSAPTGVTATASLYSATVQWSAPASNGGLSVTRYSVTPFRGATPRSPSVVTGSPPGTSVLVTGLTGGPYTFTVTASNAWANSAASAPSSPIFPLILAPPGQIVTFAGSVGSGPALSIGQYPYAVAVAVTHVYVGDFANPVVRDVNTGNGHESPLAGNDGYGYTGDGGPATSAMIQGAGAIAYCGPGLTYIADTYNYVIRRIDGGGVITTVAGTGQPGYTGDGGPAASATLSRVFGLACRTGGGLYISDSDNRAVRILDAAGNIKTWWYGFSFNTGLVEVSGQDNVDVADSGSDNAVWNLTDLNARVIAGIPGYSGFNGDNQPATSAELSDPRGLAADGTWLYIADRANNRIRTVNLQTQIITTYAGTGVAGFYGDNGPPLAAQLNAPSGLSLGTLNGETLLVADSANYRVREIMVSVTPTITTIAGNGTPSLSGDGGPALQAQLGNPFAIVIDPAGNQYVADAQNDAIRKIDPTGVITTVAGNGVAGFSGDGGPATSAKLNDPRGVALDASGNLYISDSGNQRIRKVDLGGNITTIAGTGVAGYSGDSSATSAQINYPQAVAVDGSGNVYIADSANDRVRKVTAGGVISTFAGTGVNGYSGDSSPATAAQLNNPRGLAVDVGGNVFIGDSGNNRVRKVDHSTGLITTVAGNGTAGVGGDNGTATSAQLHYPFGLAFDSAGNLYIADARNQSIRLVDTHGLISTLVGECGVIAGFSGDGGPAAFAHVNFPVGVAVDAYGNLYIADVDNNRVRGAAGLAGLRAGSCPSLGGTAAPRGTLPGPVAPPSTRIDQQAAGPRLRLSDQPLRDQPTANPNQTGHRILLPSTSTAGPPASHAVVGGPPPNAPPAAAGPSHPPMAVPAGLLPAAARPRAAAVDTGYVGLLVPLALISLVLLAARRSENRRLNGKTRP